MASTLDIGVVATGSMLCWVGIVSNPQNLVEHAYQMGSQADQLVVALEAHVEPVVAPALDLALLVQPGGQRPVFLGRLELLDPHCSGMGVPPTLCMGAPQPWDVAGDRLVAGSRTSGPLALNRRPFSVLAGRRCSRHDHHLWVLIAVASRAARTPARRGEGGWITIGRCWARGTCKLPGAG